MRIDKRFFLIGLVLFLVITIPVTAKMNVTTLDDGRTKFSNGTYWITWDPIGRDVVGDKFFINATTNLAAGTEFSYGFYLNTYTCHQKVCNTTGWGTWGFTTVEAGNTTSPNTTSILIDTTGFRSGDYDFTFGPTSSNVSAEYNAFYDDFFIRYNRLILPVTQIPSPTKSSLPIILTFGALLGSALIVIMKKRREG